MIKQYRSYSDHEIANYVLGVKLADNTMAGIQHNLSNDNAAAARALKWEACFLGLVDGLQPEPPDATILANIQTTLDIKLATADNAPVLGDKKNNDAICKAYLEGKSKPKKTKFSKAKIIIAAIMTLIVVLFIWSSLDNTQEKTMVKETLNLVN